MSKIVLSRGIIEKNDISVSSAIFLLALANNVDYSVAQKELVAKGLISEKLNAETFEKEGYFITRKGGKVLESIIIDSETKDKAPDFQIRVDNLVPQMQEIYPKGKNFNNQYWRGNKTDIRRRLLTFFKKYGEEYTDEQILTATRAYVKGFNGEYKFMRLLQYFIWKEEIKDGTKVPTSDLANYMENEGQENESLTTDWMNTLN